MNYIFVIAFTGLATVGVILIVNGIYGLKNEKDEKRLDDLEEKTVDIYHKLILLDDKLDIMEKDIDVIKMNSKKKRFFS